MTTAIGSTAPQHLQLQRQRQRQRQRQLKVKVKVQRIFHHQEDSHLLRNHHLNRGLLPIIIMMTAALLLLLQLPEAAAIRALRPFAVRGGAGVAAFQHHPYQQHRQFQRHPPPHPHTMERRRSGTTGASTTATTSTRLWSSSSSSSSSNTSTSSKAATTKMVSSQATSVAAAAATTTNSQSSSTSSAFSSRTKIVHLVSSSSSSSSSSSYLGQTVTVMGWVRTIRKQKTLAFVQINDGSNLAGIQAIVDLKTKKKQEEENTDSDDGDGDALFLSDESLQAVSEITTGAAVRITGRVVASPQKDANQQIVLELEAREVEVMGSCPADSYPLAKKRHSLEYLRTIAHLRPRTNALAAISRVRSQLAFAIHDYFARKQGFTYVQTPLITASDCEGAGELFRVTTLPLQDDVSKLPVTTTKTANTDNTTTATLLDFSKDFFGKPAFLTVSGQLGAETHACALGDVYTFGPTFRAENSQTSRHLAEFHMVEPEMAFCDLSMAMDSAEDMLKSVLQHALQNCRPDLEFFQKFYDPKLLERLESVVHKPFARVSYRQAIEFLQHEIAKDPSKWQFPDVVFGTDLATEHERWLAEQKFGGGGDDGDDNGDRSSSSSHPAVFVYNYPKSIKAFYMRDNDEDNGETVNAMDLLVPGVGELIGGSQREDRLDKLVAKMEELDLNPDDYWWYLDLRRYGSVPHAGYGLGFERLVTYVCGVENIREAIAFPRYPGNAEF